MFRSSVSIVTAQLLMISGEAGPGLLFDGWAATLSIIAQEGGEYGWIIGERQIAKHHARAIGFLYRQKIAPACCQGVKRCYVCLTISENLWLPEKWLPAAQEVKNDLVQQLFTK